MSGPGVIRAETLPDTPTGGRAPVYWGMLVLIGIEATAFAALFSSYLYLRFLTPEWPPAGTDAPPVFLPLINTAVLAAVAALSFFATRGMREGRTARLKVFYLLIVLIGTIHLVVRLFTIRAAGYEGALHAFGSISLTIDIIHFAHVAAAVLMTCVALALAFSGRFTRERRLGPQVVNLFWQFVFAAWIGVFAIVHLVPRFL